MISSDLPGFMFDGKVRTSRTYGGSRRVNGSQSRGDVLEKTRQEREARALEKQRRQAAIVIQALARRAISNIKCKIILQQEFNTSINNINKMSTLLKSAGKTFIVPSEVMVKLLRTFILFFDLSANATEVNMIMTLYLKYIADECSRLELCKEHLRGTWVYLFGRLYGVSFRLLRESNEGKSRGDWEDLIMNVINSIPRVSNILSGEKRKERSTTTMAPHFMVENCICLGELLLQDDEKKAGAVMHVLVDALEKVATEKLFQQLMSSPQDQEHPWVRVIWAIARDVLPVKNLIARPCARSLGGILCAQGGMGWRVCLFLLLHRLGTTTEEIRLKENVLANYFAHVELEVAGAEQVYETLWPSTLTLSCMESNYFSWLGLVDQVLGPYNAPTGSASQETILRVLVNKELIGCSLRHGLLSSNADTATAIMSLYGKILFWFSHDERVTQTILGTHLYYHELNSKMWGFLQRTLYLQVSVTGETIFESTMDTWCRNSGTDFHSRTLYCVLLFCRSLYNKLLITDDEDFLASGCVVGEMEMASLIEFLNVTLLRFYRLAVSKDTTTVFSASSGPPNDAELRQTVHVHATHLYNHIFKIDDRRHFFPDQRIWQWTSIPEQDLVLSTSSEGHFQNSTQPSPLDEDVAVQMDVEEGDGDDPPSRSSPLRNPVTWKALKDHPQVIPFERRVAIFRDLLEEDKIKTQGDAFGGWSRGVGISVDRGDVVRSAFEELDDLDSTTLKGKLQVQFISKQGYQEAGIDGGGLFKEFMDDLISHLFGQEQDLFVSTGENLLVPNPEALDSHRRFAFAGKMLGKALYESLLVDPQFSSLFLNVLLGKRNQMDDLALLDQELYANMKKLKHMAARGEDVGALDLYFEVQRQGKAEPLKEGGSSEKVTNENHREYIYMFADFKLNKVFNLASKSFNDGLHGIIPKDWISLFSPSELQRVIGGEKRGINIEDMMKYTNYAGGYAQSQPYIQAFWRIVGEMDVEQQGNLLKFITSCSRQPLRGFAELSHQICIQKVPQFTEDQFLDANHPSTLSARLPSAATCVNLLKLPEYDNVDVLKEKLLYAITNNNTGFELS